MQGNNVVDIIINNAGIISETGKTIENVSIENVSEMFNVNVFGVMRVTKYFLPLICRSNNGYIINISSDAAQDFSGMDYGYSLSKICLNMLTVKLKNYLHDKKIKVYAIHPGWIKTDMGGEKAPLNPMEPAIAILDMVSGTKNFDQTHYFYNYKGEKM